MGDLRVTCNEGGMQGETCLAKKVPAFKSTEILPPAVSDAALESLVLQKTSLYMHSFNALFSF